MADRLRDIGFATTPVGVEAKPWTLDALPRLLVSPTAGGCEALGIRQTLAHGGEPAVAESIRAAAAWLGQPAPFVDTFAPVSLAEVGALFCGIGGCPEQGRLPPDLANGVAAVLFRIYRVIEAEEEVRGIRGVRTVDEWATRGGDGLLASRSGAGFDPSFPDDRAYLTASRAEVFETAAALAEAIAAVNWSSFRGQRGVEWRLETPWGPAWVVDGAPQAHRFDEAPMLLVDLGGDDTYRGRAGSTSAARPVAVVVDVGGADHHAYPEWSPTSTTSALPADADGRFTGDRFVGASLSTVSQQGAARTGVALWFDLGGDDDVYIALRASQGYAHYGVGVLYDDGGNDQYRLEAAGQGAAQFGIGLLMDLGAGNDLYHAEHTAQGLGYAAGAGVLYDDGGDDAYECPASGLRYPAPQREGAQASLCQGAGFGYRDSDPMLALPGGLGVLVDRAGDDRYRAGVFGQGVGLAEGLGVLVDDRGRDAYDVLWHGQGAGVHAGVGVLVDGGADGDRYGAGAIGENVMMGAGHDRGVGLFFDRGGDDEYALTSLSGGAATCGGVGLFVDEAGNDTYLGSGRLALGRYESAGCTLTGYGLMVDAGGIEAYPAGSAALEMEAWSDGLGGFGLDADGDSGLVSGRVETP